MRRVPYGELEIVGFNEAVKDVPCARVLPVVKHPLVVKDTLTEIYFTLSKGDEFEAEVSDWWSKDELDSFVVENRVTLLPGAEKIKAFPSALMLYITGSMLAATEWDWPSVLNEEERHRWSLADDGGETLVFCAPTETIHALMNRAGRQLVEKTTRLLVQSFAYKGQGLTREAGRACEEAERLADMARAATTDRTLRSYILLRLGVAITNSDTPERWDNLRPMVLRSFPKWTWEALTEQVDSLARRLRTQAAQGVIQVVKSNGAGDDHKKGLIDKVNSIVKIPNERERRLAAQMYAREHRQTYPVDEEILGRIEEELIKRGATDKSHIYLEGNDLLLVALAGEEALYDPDIFTVLPTSRAAVNLVAFLRKVTKDGLLLSGSEDLMDASSLAGKLKTREDPPSAHLRSLLSATTSSLLDLYHLRQQPSQRLTAALVEDLNRLLTDASLYEESFFRGVGLAQEVRALIAQKLQGMQLLRRNRLLLEAAYPREIMNYQQKIVRSRPIAARVQTVSSAAGQAQAAGAAR